MNMNLLFMEVGTSVSVTAGMFAGLAGTVIKKGTPTISNKQKYERWVQFTDGSVGVVCNCFLSKV